jgi:hypothetical protein
LSLGLAARLSSARPVPPVLRFRPPNSAAFHAETESQRRRGEGRDEQGAHANALKTPQTRRSRSVVTEGATRE